MKAAIMQPSLVDKRLRLGFMTFALTTIALVGSTAWSQGVDDFLFFPPECVTAAYHPVVMDSSDPYYLLDNYRMSRNPGGSLAFDSSGTLHLTYWSGFTNTNPGSPAAVYYQSWSPAAGWSANEIVDQSLSHDPGYLGQRIGGRNPSLALDRDDRVWITWCDYRDCGIDPPYNGINNTEIYYDWKPTTGSFTLVDFRLTETAAAHFGDNGYAPRIVASPDGKMTIMWYDFYLDGSISDIYMMTSDAIGNFDTITTPMLSRRITDEADRQPVPPQTLKPAFSMPDFVITPEGRRYAVWTEGFGGSMGGSGPAPIYFAELPEQPDIVTYEVIVLDNDGFWRPPKIKLAGNGDLWVVYTVKVDASRYIELLRRPNGQTQFDTPIRITSSGRSQNADLAIDNEGRLHLVWTEYGGFQSNHINYALLDVSGLNQLRAEQLTNEAGPFEQPCIALNEEQLPHVAFSEGATDIVGAQGDIWFVRCMEKEQLTNSRLWVLYK